MDSPDMRLQLIIEAVNRTDQAWKQLRAQVETAKADLAGVGSTGEHAGHALDAAGTKGAAAMDRVHDHAGRAHSMLGQMVQMAIVMGTVLGSKKLVDTAIDYNKTLETSKLGIAAIMTSMGVITNQQGQVLKGEEKWNAAQGLTLDAQRELQRIAMATPATYEEVVQAYQGLLAPSLGAKLNFKDTLELAGLMTNAVKAMGLPAQQIVQEGRDLVAGTIDQNSQLARSLQITNEDVKKWREKGTVFQEIKGRLEGFTYASREFENTWEGAWSNFKDYAQKALGEGSKSPFEFLKHEMIRLSNEMVNITKNDKGKIIDVQVKPEVATRIRELSDELIKLIKFIETAISWGSKLAEPAMYVAVAAGIGKITTAVRELSVASKSINATLIGALLTATVYLGKAAYDAHDTTETADVAKRYKAQGGKDDLSWLGPQKLAELKNQQGMDNEAVARALKAGVLKQSQGPNDNIYGWSDFDFNAAALKKFLEGGASTDKLTGSGKKTAEEIKKAREQAISALADSYAESEGIYKTGEAREAETIKTGLKEKELLYQQGLLSQEEYNQARAALQRQGLVNELNAISGQQVKLTKKYQSEAAVIEDPKELSEKHKAYVTEWYKLEVDYEKKKAELKRTGLDEDLKQIELRKQMEATERDGGLKILQERLNGEKQLTQLLLERERISPLEAERRNIANEQAGLEAEYWKTFGEKMAAGVGSKERAAREYDLQVLEQRMANLDQATPDRLYKAGKDTSNLEAKREEARINLELSKIDYGERDRSISKDTAAGERVRLTRELLGLQTARLEQLAQEGQTGSEAWNSQAAAIEATRGKFFDLTQLLRERTGTYGEGLTEGFRRFNDESKKFFQQGLDMARATAGGMEQAFSDGFFDVMQAKFNTLGQYVLNFLQAIQRAIANFLAQQATNALISNIGSLATSLFGASSAGGASPLAGEVTNLSGASGGYFTFASRHQGGIIPRFHFGGLASNEVPAVLLKNERVLSIEQNQLFERFVNKTEQPSGGNVVINIENKTGADVKASQSSPRFDGKQIVHNIVVELMHTSPSFRGLIRG